MKELRWTEPAVTDLEGIADYLFERAPDRAAGLVNSVHAAVSDLLPFPYRGRTGKRSGTRELVLTGLPYLVVYRVSREGVEVLRVLHGAQRWP